MITIESKVIIVKKNNWLIIILIGVLSITLIGISFAYFHAKILGNDKALKNKVQAGTLELSFVDDNAISITNENGKPGSKASKTFSVTNTSTLDEDFTYNIKLVMTELTFVKRDLKYTLEEYSDATFDKPNGLKEEGYINTDSVNEKNEMYLAVDIPRPAKGATHYYKLTVDFQELNIPQDYNQEAKFIGKVNVDDEKDMKVYEQAPNAPELYQGMIPVTFDASGNVYVADVNSDWYNYDDSKWANAVLVDNSKDGVSAKYFDGTKLKEGIDGTQIPMDEILQMYVWIPRYRYKLFNTDNQEVQKQLIDIEFEKGTETTGNVSCTYTDMKNGTVLENCKNATNGNWYTHPAFTFGDTELKGIWVGKFEPSDPNYENGRAENTINEITILPNETSMVLKNVSTMFNAERDIENKNATKYNLNSKEVDTHMMKNSEWGAVAYLTQSIYGVYKDEKTCNIDDMEFDECRIWKNNTAQGAGSSIDLKNRYGGTATGCVGTSVSVAVEWNKNDDGSPAVCPEGRQWNQSGVKASTTGNMYGIYDMSGGAYEYVMGVLVKDEVGGLNTLSSGFPKNQPNSKYYELYTFSELDNTYERGHLGDATREILENFKSPGGWNSATSSFPSTLTWPDVWFARGGEYENNMTAGIFFFSRGNGGGYTSYSFRSVLTAQDGVD